MPRLDDYKRKLDAIEAHAATLLARYQDKALVSKQGREKEVADELNILKRFEKVASQSKAARGVQALEKQLKADEMCDEAFQEAQNVYVKTKGELQHISSGVLQQQEALLAARAPFEATVRESQERLSMREEEHFQRVSAHQKGIDNVQALLQTLPKRSDEHNEIIKQLAAVSEDLNTIEAGYELNLSRVGAEIDKLDEERQALQEKVNPNSTLSKAFITKVLSRERKIKALAIELEEKEVVFHQLNQQREHATKDVRVEITRLLEKLGTPGSAFQAALDERSQRVSVLDAMKKAYEDERLDLVASLGDANHALKACVAGQEEKLQALDKTLRETSDALQACEDKHAHDEEVREGERAETEQQLKGVERLVTALEKDMQRSARFLEGNVEDSEEAIVKAYHALSETIQAVKVQPLSNEALRDAHQAVQDKVAAMQALDNEVQGKLATLEDLNAKASAIAQVKTAYEAYVVANDEHQEQVIREKKDQIRQDITAFKGRLNAYYNSVASDLDLLGSDTNLVHRVAEAKSMDELDACAQQLESLEGSLLLQRHGLTPDPGGDLNLLVKTIHAVDDVFQKEIDAQENTPKVQAQLQKTRTKVFDAIVNGKTLEDGIEQGCNHIEQDLVGDMKVRMFKDLIIKFTLIGLLLAARRVAQGKSFFYSDGKPEAVQASKNLKAELGGLKHKPERDVPDDVPNIGFD